MGAGTRRDTPKGLPLQGSAGRRVLSNTVWLTLGQGGALVGMTLWTAIVARYVGPEVYGTYSHANAVMAIVLVLVMLGMDQLLVRDVAQRPQSGWPLLTVSLVIRVALCAVVLGGFLAVGLWRGAPHEWMVLVGLLTLNNLATAVGMLALDMLYAREAMAVTVLAHLANSGLTLVTGAVAVWLRQSFALIVALSFTATLVQGIIAFWATGRAYGRVQVSELGAHLSRQAAAGLLRQALPFAAISLMAALQSQLVLVLLGWRVREAALLGYFSAANRIYVMVLIVPEKLSQAILPAFSRIHAESPGRFAGLFEQSYRYLFAVTAPMAIGLWVISPWLLRLMYGPGFSPAARTLRILSLVLLSGVGYVMGPAMAALNKQSLLAVIWGAMLAVMAAVGYWAIPRFGAEGAAWAALAGTLAESVVYSALLFRWLALRYPTAWMCKVLLAASGMGCVAHLLAQHTNVMPVALAVSPLAYGLFLLLLCPFSLEDRRRLLRLLSALAARRLSLLGRLESAVNDKTSAT